MLEVFRLRTKADLSLVANDHFHAYCDRHTSVYLGVQEEFRRRCAMLKSARDEGVMAIHIRRGDAMKEPRRVTSLEKIALVIDVLKKMRPDLRIKIYSEGHVAEFANLPADEFHLNRDVFQTIGALADAEILLMAKSSFSYVAALLSRGQVIYEPFWHRPLPSWTNVDELLKTGRPRQNF
jgi:hypothetical protein